MKGLYMKYFIKTLSTDDNHYTFIERINQNNAEIVSIGYNDYGYIKTFVYKAEKEIYF